MFLYGAFCIPRPSVGPFDHGLTKHGLWSKARNSRPAMPRGSSRTILRAKKRFFTEFRGEATHIGLARLCEEVWLTACSRMQPSPPPLSRRRARGDSRRHRPNIPEAQTGLKLRENGGARTAPLQEAERNRCRGGRAAWMPREACGAMDGPSRRAPGATM
ncbi:hypothetical protein D9M71_482840 [compost metagenome]